MTIHLYSSPASFKQALEQRLRSATETGGELARRRQLLVFDRFLARIVAVLGDAVTLKGGLVLELRLERARTTKDIDLRLMGAPDKILAKLQEAGRLDVGDFMSFEVGPDPDHAELRNEGLQYDGLRFRATCGLAGKLYGQPFGVDVAFGEPIFGEPDVVVAEDLLAFAGVAPPSLRLYPIATHVAEKLHAYTMPRARPNSRVKDLPDLALLATAQPMFCQAPEVGLRSDLLVPQNARIACVGPNPAGGMESPYAAMAREDHLAWPSLDDLTTAVQHFLDPVLAGNTSATWDPFTWTWKPR